MAKTRRRKNVHRRRTKKHRRRHQTKRRVKRRRKTTRKKRGRGISPSKMAKVGVATLAATAAAGKAMGHGISPQKGTAAAVQHFQNVPCNQFHISDVVPHSEDHGMSTEHYRPVLSAALGKKRSCKRTKQSMRKPKPKKKPGESTRKFGRRKRRERRAAKVEQERQQEIEREAMDEMRAEQQQQQQQQPTTATRRLGNWSKGSRWYWYRACCCCGNCGIEKARRRTERKTRTGSNGSSACRESSVPSPSVSHTTERIIKIKSFS